MILRLLFLFQNYMYRVGRVRYINETLNNFSKIIIGHPKKDERVEKPSDAYVFYFAFYVTGKY